MDSNIQRVFGILVATVIFYLFPMYVTFEKKDDVSYALALRVTYNFVNNVKNKGYISQTMYSDFLKQLSVTGNSYDIKLEHVRKRYDPAIYAYDSTYSNILRKFDYNIYKSDYDNLGRITVGSNTYTNLILSYAVNEEVYTEKQILEVLNRQISTSEPAYGQMSQIQYKTITNILQNSQIYEKNIYVMNSGDEFAVRIVNKNTTIATVLFNALTLGLNSPNNTRVYINYGGTIINESYRTFLDNMRYINNQEINYKNF
ncbi:MAG: hypothetical protein N2749_06990 [Clostridia bacterium]|nr:hypothetical protein [Clostridia bacterium]